VARNALRDRQVRFESAANLAQAVSSVVAAAERG